MNDLPVALVTGLAFVFGTVIGSFLNVVIHRVPRGESVVTPPSACPSCGHPIRNRHNVPVLGWLVLRGRCADCGQPISARYPLVELGTGLLWAALAWRFADQPALLPAYLFFGSLAVALALIDLDVRRLPDVLVLPAYPLLAVLLLLGADRSDLLRAGIAGALLFGFYLLVATLAPRGMGFGDVKLAGLVGAAVGYVSWGAFLTGAFGAFLLGALAGAALIALGRAGRRSAVPFGPFMLLAAVAALLGADGLGDAYLRAVGAV
jgi:leader peptidase (prepilin peptidase)/N-methyltransferase